MIEALFTSGVAAFDVLAPIAPDFYLFTLPEGGLLTYGWRFDGPPKEGIFLAWQEDGAVGGWVETDKPDGAKWRIAAVTTYKRENDPRTPEQQGEDAVQRVSLCQLSPVGSDFYPV